VTAWGAFVALCETKAPRGRLMAVAWRLSVVAASATALVLAASAAAAPAPPSGLEVQGGEDAWHPDRSFRLRWSNPPGVAAVHYVVRDPAGSIAVGPQRIGWATSEIDSIQVPGPPGAYTAKVWLEDPGGGQGPVAEAKLRFDDTRPATVAPLPAEAWFGRTDFPVAIRLAHPAGGEPPSGLRGFAVSIDPAPGGEPCVAASLCTESETDLHGAGNDSFPIAELPDGIWYLHAVAVSGAGIRSATTGRAILRVDKTSPAVSLSGLPASWSNRALTLIASASDGGSGMQPGAAGSVPFTAIRIDGGRPISAAGDSVSTGLFSEGVHTIAYYARDLAGNVDDGDSSNGIANREPKIATARLDRTPPRISFANAQDPREPETIRARVADDLSGPDEAGGWIGIRRAGSGDPFAPLPPAAGPGDELRARWDSDAYPPGAYEFEATGRDRAGNAATSSRRADGSSMVLPNPLKVATEVGAAFDAGSPPRHCAPHRGRRRCRLPAIDEPHRRVASRTIPYGRGVVLSGELRNAAGSPLGGSRPLRVIESVAGGGAASTSTVWTDPSGAFAYRLPPGPSRQVRVAFAGSQTLAASASEPLDLSVRCAVSLHLSAKTARVGGAPIVFRGLVAAAPGAIPTTGRAVELQFRLPGLPWSEFRTLRTDQRGRFRYAYRFSDDDSRGARFQFRAYAPAQDDWPYEPGGSLPVAVRGI
jgi:hypothetical protein